jgi:orotidine-5'-phosphate decarboxylase
MDAKDRIIVALDVDTRREALEWVSRLGGRVGLFKIGSQLFTSEGPTLVREIVQRGERVFLDLKFHDIPSTVAKSVVIAADLGVTMLTLHASGGRTMMGSAVEALNRISSPGTRPLLLGVTVLTSLAGDEFDAIGFSESVESQVVRLAKLAEQSGLDGVVASPSELALLRSQLKASTRIITPGIRPAGSAAHDQSRSATPAAAIQAGADYLVIGRPIIASSSPLASLEAITKNLSAGSAGSNRPR